MSKNKTPKSCGNCCYSKSEFCSEAGYNLLVCINGLSWSCGEYVYPKHKCERFRQKAPKSWKVGKAGTTNHD